MKETSDKVFSLRVNFRSWFVAYVMILRDDEVIKKKLFVAVI